MSVTATSLSMIVACKKNIPKFQNFQKLIANDKTFKALV